MAGATKADADGAEEATAASADAVANEESFIAVLPARSGRNETRWEARRGCKCAATPAF